MSVSPTEHADLDDLGAALRRELDTARRRLDELQTRRERLRRELDAATAAEEEGRQALAALRSVAARAGRLIAEDELALDEATATHALAGSELREAITRIALRRNAHGDAVHWSTWFGWL